MATKTSFLPSRNASMALVRSSWSRVGELCVRTIVAMLGVAKAGQAGARNGKAQSRHDSRSMLVK